MNQNKLFSSSKLDLEVGYGVLLDPGFKSEYGSVFSATINTTTPCGTNNGAPFRFNQPQISANQIADLQNKIKISPIQQFSICWFQLVITRFH